MSEFAKAINAELAAKHVAPPPPPGSYWQEPRRPEPQESRPAYAPAAKMQPVPLTISAIHRGVTFVIRENGIASFGQLPVGSLCWHVFMTDAELETPPSDLQGRKLACMRAIERSQDGARVWEGPWHKRPDPSCGLWV